MARAQADPGHLILRPAVLAERLDPIPLDRVDLAVRPTPVAVLARLVPREHRGLIYGQAMVAVAEDLLTLELAELAAMEELPAAELAGADYRLLPLPALAVTALLERST